MRHKDKQIFGIAKHLKKIFLYLFWTIFVQMEYLFKTLIINHNGTAAYEVFEKEDGKYYCIMASWKGYSTGPGSVTLTQVGKRWKSDPESFTEIVQLVEAIDQFFNQ